MLIEGGTFLGQGTYGCVFFPSVLCHNREDKKKKYQKGVSKVFKYDYQMREELDESKKITKLDRDGKYTNKALGSCAFDPIKIDMDDSEQCKHTRVSPSNSAPEFMHQIIYEHKGIDLKHAMRRPYSITDMFDHVLNLMKGVQLLGGKKYAHMDLKPPNACARSTGATRAGYGCEPWLGSLAGGGGASGTWPAGQLLVGPHPADAVSTVLSKVW